jgi:hypothetical protein
LITKAKENNSYAVLNEKYKDHGSKMLNICGYFEIGCRNLKKFMELESWKF